MSSLNTGTSYSIQPHTFVNEQKNGQWSTYDNFDVEFFRNAPAVQSGTVTNLGYSNPNQDNPQSIYGGPRRRTDFIALNHSGYFVPTMTGPYTFSAPNCDDIVILWLGDVANSGKWNRDNAMLIQTYSTSAKSYTPFLTANKQYPMRVLLGNGQGGAVLFLKVVDPSGAEVAI
ncbi:GLEYA domain-containing protein [Trichophaea hybrida]|nr:GLEYA domain-containing protein [Trichophaea hybrida]